MTPLSQFSFRWPQSTIPTFKILTSECLDKDQIAEQISLVRFVLLVSILKIISLKPHFMLKVFTFES